MKGLATIHDKDVLIFCVSQLVAALNAGRPVSPTLHLKAHDLLSATGREARATATGGCARLSSGCRAPGSSPTSRPAASSATRGFGLIDAWEILRKAQGRADDPGDRDAVGLDLPLGDGALGADAVRDYFRLRKPLERRVYEIARKHCGGQAEWRIGLETLLKKTGSTSPRRVFRKMIRDIAEEDGLPDYRLEVDGRRHRLGAAAARRLRHGRGGGAAARPGGARPGAGGGAGADVHALEADWRRFWAARGRPALRSPEAAFLAFVRARALRAGGLTGD